ncbi:MAG: hypothetical protein AAF628_03505 [Planctomycetota bacterium]
MTNKDLSATFESYRRDRKRRRMENSGPTRHLGKNASVIQQLEEAERSQIREAQLAREANEFLADATRAAAGVVQHISEEVEKESEQRLGGEMEDFLGEVKNRAESCVKSLKTRCVDGDVASSGVPGMEVDDPGGLLNKIGDDFEDLPFEDSDLRDNDSGAFDVDETLAAEDEPPLSSDVRPASGIGQAAPSRPSERGSAAAPPVPVFSGEVSPDEEWQAAAEAEVGQVAKVGSRERLAALFGPPAGGEPVEPAALEPVAEPEPVVEAESIVEAEPVAALEPLDVEVGTLEDAEERSELGDLDQLEELEELDGLEEFEELEELEEFEDVEEPPALEVAPTLPEAAPEASMTPGLLLPQYELGGTGGFDGFGGTMDAGDASIVEELEGEVLEAPAEIDDDPLLLEEVASLGLHLAARLARDPKRMVAALRALLASDVLTPAEASEVLALLPQGG